MQLVISDHHRGLMNAINATMIGAAWQRCRVHFMRNVLTKVTKGHADMVAAAIRTIFPQPTGPLVRAQVEAIAAMLDPQLPAVAAMLRAAREEITAFADFPEAHWRKAWSTNPIERLNKEVKRRTDVIRIFPKSQGAATTFNLFADRGPRRVAGRRPPLPVQSIHGGAYPSTAHRLAPDRTRAEGDLNTRRDDDIISDSAEATRERTTPPHGARPWRLRLTRLTRFRKQCLTPPDRFCGQTSPPKWPASRSPLCTNSVAQLFRRMPGTKA